MSGPTYRFAGFELDPDNRELRGADGPRALQPQAFAVLAYLVAHRDRAVSKRELLDALWPDATVGDGSVQRAVHLVRAALGDDGRLIRTVPKHGYRFAGDVERLEAESPAAAPFQPRFARSGEVHIAYHTVGTGGLDIVLVPGWAFPMRSFLDLPELRGVIDGFARLGRVVLFDKRGTGLSDRVKDLPDLEQRMDDLRAVLEAAQSREAVLVGFSEGGPLCLLYASSYPERTRGLLLVGAFARWAASPDYPHGWSAEVVTRLRAYIGRAWGAGETIKATVHSRAGDPTVGAWAASAEQQGASPGAALELMAMNLQIDVRALLPAVTAPTVILHHRDDPVIGVANGRYLAAHIPGARYVELDGSDHVFLFEHRDRLVASVAELVAAQRAPVQHFLSTVMVASIDGTVDAVELARELDTFRAVPEGEGVWSFDGPQRAIRAAHALIDVCARRGTSARAGVHTGEVYRAGDGLGGDGVLVARRIAAVAPLGRVWTSRVVRDLVHGASLRFADGGSVDVSPDRRVDAVTSLGPDGKETVRERKQQ